MLEPLISLLLKLTVFIYGLAVCGGIFITVSSFMSMARLADNQNAMVSQEVTPAHLMSRIVFGAFLAASNAVAVATAISLGGNSNEIIDPTTILNYSDVIGGSEESQRIVVFVKTLSRFLGSVAMTSGIKHGSNFNHPNENVRKNARYRLAWGVTSGVALIFPDFTLSLVEGYHSSLKLIADLFKQVP